KPCSTLVLRILPGVIQRDDPEDRILTLGSAAHLPTASCVMNDHDCNFLPSQIEQPRKHSFPTVGFILFQAESGGGQVVDEQHFDASVDAVSRDCVLNFLVGNVEDFASALE